MKLNYEDAVAVHVAIRSLAAQLEDSAAERDRLITASNATEATKIWAEKTQRENRDQAVRLRDFARFILDSCEGNG